jgi:hypothetical protein
MTRESTRNDTDRFSQWDRTLREILVLMLSQSKENRSAKQLNNRFKSVTGETTPQFEMRKQIM